MLSKNKILKKLKVQEEALLDAIEDIRDFLDSTEDPDLSSRGAEFCDSVIDFIHDNDISSLNGIRDFIDNELGT